MMPFYGMVRQKCTIPPFYAHMDLQAESRSSSANPAPRMSSTVAANANARGGVV